MKRFSALLAALWSPLFLFAQSLTVSIQVTTAPCAPTATFTALAGGGTAPYTYAWSNGASGPDLVGVSGAHTVTVTDAAGGSSIATQTYAPPPAVGVSTFGQSAICAVAPDGIATVVPYAGTPPYTYLWSTGATTAQATGLAEGDYSVTVSDANGCTQVSSVNIISWNEGLWLMDSTGNVSCHGLADGTTVVMPMSGTAPYTYNWNTGATTPNLSSLGPGLYVATVSDVNGCSAEWDLVVSEPSPLAASATTMPQTGLQPNGTIEVTVAGGTPPFSYRWADAPQMNTATRTNLAAGTYTVSVQDAHACETVVEAVVDFIVETTMPRLPGVKITPNPTADGYFAVSLPAPGRAVSLSWWNTQGQRLGQLPVAAGQTRVEAFVGDLPAGVYVLRLGDVVIGALIRR